MALSSPSWVRRSFTLDLRSLACFRVGLGAITLADALLRTRDATLMLAPDGMFPIAALREFFGDRWAWSLAFLVDATWWGVAVLALEALAGAALAAGLFTRVATIAAWLAVVSVVRRTAPATNAGDEWLCCLLFWGMFLPLGATWSVDAARRGRPRDLRACSAATVALLLQIAAVYLGAGSAKWNATWLSGAAVATALSTHDHGTAWGDALAGHDAVCRLLTWAVVALENLGPCLLVATGRPAVRGALVTIFFAFHAATAALMSLGLFAFVGMAAWLAVVPTAWWEWWSCGRESGPRVPAEGTDSTGSGDAAGGRRLAGRRGGLEAAVVAAALGIAGLSFLHEQTAWRKRPLPAPIGAAVRLTCLAQDWGMFGEVRRQRQWVYGRGTLADGRVVDVLRGGRPLEETLPAGGFTSLPHHRWHKLFWDLPNPARRVFSPSIAAALARDWNRRHDAPRQLTALEIRAARVGADPLATLHDLLLASWPARDPGGSGNLDRWLTEQTTPGEPARSEK